MLEERLVPGLAVYLDTRDGGGRQRTYTAALVQMARLLSPLLRRYGTPSMQSALCSAHPAS